jgi:sulfur carrier protein ThiS
MEGRRPNVDRSFRRRSRKETSSRSPKGTLFRFYEELNDYLPEKTRKMDLSLGLKGPTTIGTAIAALGIPAGEVDLVLVNGRSVGLGHRLRDGDRVSVYPIFEQLDISGVTRVREKPLITLRQPPHPPRPRSPENGGGGDSRSRRTGRPPRR